MSSSTHGASVRIVEVGPRDGLQNVPGRVPTDTKLQLISKLQDAGLRDLEITSVVNPRAIPQLADCEAVLASPQIQSLLANPGIRAPVLIPNLKGLDVALKHSVKEVAVFVSASEGFSKANIRCSVWEGLGRARQVASSALYRGLMVRGYVSCVFACPFDGPTPHEAVLKCVRELLSMGCYEVSLGDTVGVGVPTDVRKLIQYLLDAGMPGEKLAGHFHDTYGQAIANVWAAYDCGIRVFDSSVAGLGGCPYAPGAKGNLATEDLVYTLHQAGVDTGVDLAKLVDVGRWISQRLSIPNSSRAGSALGGKRGKTPRHYNLLQPNLEWAQQASGDGIEVFRSGTTNLKVVLNRPSNGNALTAAMISNLTELFENASRDSSITRIILTARGKYFCTGMDLGRGTSPVAQGGDAADAQYNRLKRLFEAIDNAPQVTIACVQGQAFGGGVGLIFACDIRLLSAAATIKLSEVRLGLAPATISKYVIRELGTAFAREVMLSARAVTAQELLKLGKVAAIIDDSTDPQAAVDAYIERLRRCAPRASALTKDLVRMSWLEGGGGEKQAQGIRNVFDEMMRDDGESKHGLAQFQSGMKECDWDAFTLSKIRAKARL